MIRYYYILSKFHNVKVVGQGLIQNKFTSVMQHPVQLTNQEILCVYVDRPDGKAGKDSKN